MFSSGELLNERISREVDWHEIRHALTDTDYFIRECTCVTARRDHITEKLPHIDMDNAAIRTLLEDIHQEFYLCAFPRALGTEEENSNGAHD